MASPLAYLLTWRTYGSWLPGDERGWIDNDHNPIGHPVGAHDSVRQDRAADAMRGRPVVMNDSMRGTVEAAIRGVCSYKEWRLIACAARTNHVHVLLSSGDTPEKAMNTLKAWGTRRLRESGDIGPDRDVWARHGSTIWLWTVEQVEQKRDYVLRLQDGSERARLKRRSTY